jgi:hypothetical protein
MSQDELEETRSTLDFIETLVDSLKDLGFQAPRVAPHTHVRDAAHANAHTHAPRLPGILPH